MQASTELITLHFGLVPGRALPVGRPVSIVALLRLLRDHHAAGVSVGVLVVGTVAATFGWPSRCGGDEQRPGAFFVVIVAVCVFIGVPIAFTFGIATLSYLSLTTHMPLTIVINRMDDGISNLLLLAVPMFVFLGLLMEMTGIARVMVNFLAALVGHVKGGLSYVLLGAMYLVSGISGSKAADMAAVAPILFPEMRRGSHPGEAVVAARDLERDVGDDPAEPSADSPSARWCQGCRSRRCSPAGCCPPLSLRWRWSWSPGGGRAGGQRRRRARSIDDARTFVIAVPGLTLPFVIRFTVIQGIATATEVSTVGVVYTAFLGLLVYRQFDWRRLYPILVETVSLTGAVMMIIGTATGMAWALTQSGFSLWLVSEMAAVPGGSWGFLAVTIVAFIILGSVLEGLPAIVLFGPLLFPVAKAMGVHEVHYAMVVILAMGIGLFSPPLVGFYGACAIGRTNPDDSLWRIWPLSGRWSSPLIVAASRCRPASLGGQRAARAADELLVPL